MKNLSMAVDIGNISVKGILIDNDGNIISKCYLRIKDDYISAYGRIINILRSSINLNEYRVTSFKLTGIRKRLLERSLGREHFFNEINSLVNYASTKYKIGTIIDIGNSLKIINFKNNKITDYVIDDFNYYGRVIDKVKSILNIDSININNTRVKFNNMNTILFNYNTVSLLLNKYSKDEILLGTYNLIIDNILYNLKDIELKDNIIITGGLSLDKSFIRLLENYFCKKIIIMDNSEYSSCIGASILIKDKVLIHK